MVSAVAVAAAVHLGLDLTYIHSHFLQLGVASFIISGLLSVYLYIRSRYVAPEKLALGGNSGGHKYLIRSERTRFIAVVCNSKCADFSDF